MILATTSSIAYFVKGSTNGERGAYFQNNLTPHLRKGIF
jgi:hypothetical protein